MVDRTDRALGFRSTGPELVWVDVRLIFKSKNILINDVILYTIEKYHTKTAIKSTFLCDNAVFRVSV